MTLPGALPEDALPAAPPMTAARDPASYPPQALAWGIVAMLFLVLYFFGLSMKMGLENDRLTAKGEKSKIYDKMNRWVWGDSDETEKS